MNQFKNRIITISGEPASGKSTVIRNLKEEYEKKGYTVHVFSVGHEFRRMAQEKGLSIEEFNEYISKRENIDRLIDEAVAKRGREINSQERPNDIYIFDSRLAFHNIPDSFSIRLTVDENVAGKRVFFDNRRGEEDRYNNVEEAIEKTHKRKVAEIERYLERYGINLQDIENYKLVIDTSFAKMEDIVKEIQKCIKLEREGKEFAKSRIAPKMILPSQNEIDTLGKSPESGLNIDEWQEKLKKEGYDLTQPVKVIEVEGMIMCINGMHRVIASHRNGESLVAFEVVAKDDELIPGLGNITARRYMEDHLSIPRLVGHAWHFDTEGEDGKINYFSYDEVYPGIMKRLKTEEREER